MIVVRMEVENPGWTFQIIRVKRHKSRTPHETCRRSLDLMPAVSSLRHQVYAGAEAVTQRWGGVESCHIAILATSLVEDTRCRTSGTPIVLLLVDSDLVAVDPRGSIVSAPWRSKAGVKTGKAATSATAPGR